MSLSLIRVHPLDNSCVTQATMRALAPTLVIPRSASDEESADLVRRAQPLQISRLPAPDVHSKRHQFHYVTVTNPVPVGTNLQQFDHTLLVIPRSASDEESADLERRAEPPQISRLPR